MEGLRVAILGCFFLSGFSALVYEVAWTRILTQIFGNTTFAVATVLTAFMAGLAGGSYLGGPRADRTRRPLLAYGFLEAGIGAYGLLSPPLFSLAQRLYVALYPVLERSFILYSLLLFLLSLILLAVPTILMGATLPLLSRVVVTREETLGRGVGDLYAVNTAGAVAGCVLTGYLLIPALGIRWSMFLAATVNLAVAALAAVLAGGRPSRPAEGPGVTGAIAGPESGLEVLVLAAFALSGAAAMIYENAWTRTLALVIGSSTYAFTTMLATFLIGLAVGSFLYARWWGRAPGRVAALGALEIAMGLTALATVPLFGELPLVFLRLYKGFGETFGLFLGIQFLLSGAVMLLPTLCSGMTFPLVARLFTESVYRVGSGVGTAYAWNTVGAIGGAFAGGFLLIPLVGIQRAIEAAVVLNVGAGIALVAADPRLGRGVRWGGGAGITVAVAAALLLVPGWDRDVMTSGVTIYGRELAGLPTAGLQREAMHKDDILFYREGRTATISVHGHRFEDYRYLKTNGKVDSSYGDEPSMTLLGYLPLLLRPEARRVVIIGMGAGFTAKAVATFPVAEIRVAEIEPAVLDAARHFTDHNRRVLEDRRVTVVAADGRNYILATPTRADVIISQPSNPWIAGVANLYTREFYRVALAQLTPGGVFCQWLQTYSMAPEDLRMILRTFAGAFPYATLWAVDDSDLILLGTAGPQVWDLRRLEGLLAGNAVLREDLRRFGFATARSLAALYLMGNDALRAFAAGADLNTDDRPGLEFSAPRSLGRQTNELNMRLLRPMRERLAFQGDRGGDGIAERLALARALFATDQPDRALDEVGALLRRAPGNGAAHLLRAEILLGRDEAEEGEREVMAALRAGFRDGRRLVAVAEELSWEGAARVYQRMLALGIEPRTEIALALVRCLQALGRRRPAVRLVGSLAETAPGDPRVHLRRGLLALAEGHGGQAVRELERARDLGLLSEDLLAGLAEAYRISGRCAEAIPLFRNALSQDVKRIKWRSGLAACLTAVGARAEAERAYRTVLALDPVNVGAWEGLRAAGGRF